MLVGVAVFFADARRSRALRVAGAVIMGIPASSLVLIQLNTIWLGFVPESSYTGRMAFLLLLTMVALAFEGIAFCLTTKTRRSSSPEIRRTAPCATHRCALW